MVNETRNFQTEGSRVHHRVPVMLRCEKFVRRSEWALDGTDVEIPPVRSRIEIRILWDVRKRYECFTFCKRRQRPFRYAEKAERGKCQAASENFPASWITHMWFSCGRIVTELATD